MKLENNCGTMLGENDYYKQKYPINIIVQTLKKSHNSSMENLELESCFSESKSICF